MFYSHSCTSTSQTGKKGGRKKSPRSDRRSAWRAQSLGSIIWPISITAAEPQLAGIFARRHSGRRTRPISVRLFITRSHLTSRILDLFPPGAKYICNGEGGGRVGRREGGKVFPSKTVSSVPIKLCLYISTVPLSRRRMIERPTRGRIHRPHATAAHHFPPHRLLGLFIFQTICPTFCK